MVEIEQNAVPAEPILIVEDSPTQAEQLRQLLEGHGYAVVAAGDGVEAMVAIRTRRPALVISDVVMPVMDGYALCKAVKSEPALSDIPFVLVTSLASPDDVFRGLDCGADNFITKPYDERYLLARVNYLLTNHTLRSAGKLRMGIEIEISGKRHFISAERQQILDLLISTFSEAVHLNDELIKREQQLRTSFQVLNGLYDLSEKLSRSRTEQEASDITLGTVTTFPGVRWAWLSLPDGAGGFRAFVAPDLPPGFAGPNALGGLCKCRLRFLNGTFDDAVTIVECERLKGTEAEGGEHLSVPLVAGGRCFGILNLARVGFEPFGADEIKTLEGLGRQVGAALERADMYATLERRVAERTEALRVQMSEREEIERSLHQSQKMEAVGQLTGGVAHDFNNLLTVIIGNLELIAARVGDDAALARWAAAAQRAGSRGAELTHRLLAFSRRQVLVPQAIDVNELVHGLISMLSRTLTEAVSVRTVLADGLPSVRADPAQLESALLNLAVNARDAMPDGGTLIIETGTVTFDVPYAASHAEVAPGRYVMVAVSDTGTGIPKDIVDRVFEPFFTTKEHGKGTGLGLSMVYGFVKQSNGHVSIYTEEGEGTSIKLYFPVAGAEEAAAVPAEAVPAEMEGGETVLLVEDDADVRDIAQAMLEGLGYRVIAAADGPAALDELARRTDITLIVSDIVMPGGMSGFDLADKARAERPGIRILFTSGYTEGSARNSHRIGEGMEFISKPYQREQLGKKVRAILDSGP